MSLPARLGNELAGFLRIVLLWVGLSPAVAPIDDVVAAAPGIRIGMTADSPVWWLSVVGAALAVGWTNYAYPDVSLLRVWAFGFLSALLYFVARVVATPLLPVGDSLLRVAVLAACWLLAVGVAAVLVSPRAREKMAARADPVSRGRSD